MGRLDIKQSRRTQLIEATIDCLARYGFSEFTLSQVAKTARLSQGIVNFYFRSKEALLIETLKFMANEYEQFWTSALRKAGPRPADRLAAMIAADFDPVMTSRKKVTVWYAFGGKPAGGPNISRSARRCRKAISPRLDRCAKRSSRPAATRRSTPISWPAD